MEENDDRRSELLERFRQSLQKPVAERFFDEDELVDLFDFAGDMADDYIKLEVLMCGARLYPDSSMLRERRAIFYSQMGGDAAAKYLEDNARETAPIWEIMRLRTRDPRGKDAEQGLEFLLSGVEKLGDEEVIQFVELASQLGCFKWLTDNETLLRKKVEYLPILVYELAVVSEMNHEYDTAVRYLEELTEHEPFNAYYWYMLAQDLEILEQNERAASALDYSLAIDPEGKDALQMRARLLLGDEATRSEGISLIEELSRKFPDDVTIQSSSVFVKYTNGDISGSHETMRHCLDRFPGDRTVLSEAFATGMGDLAGLLDRFYTATDERDEEIWLDWADDLLDNGYVAEAREVLEAYMRNAGTVLSDMSSYIDTLFFMGDFKAMNALLDEATEVEDVLADRSSSYLAAILAALKCGDQARATMLIEKVTEIEHVAIADSTELMSRLTVHALLMDVRKHMADKRTDWADYDPLGMWSNEE